MIGWLEWVGVADKVCGQQNSQGQGLILIKRAVGEVVNLRGMIDVRG